MAFPTGLPSYLGFTSTHTLAADLHASQHNSEQADITAIATKVGLDASTPTSGKLLRGTSAGHSSWAQANLTTDVTGVLPVANGGTGTTSTTGTGSAVFATSPALTTPTLSAPTIADYSNADHNHQNSGGGGVLVAQALPKLDLSLQTVYNPYKFSVYRNAAVNAGTNPLVFDTNIFDTSSNYSVSTGKFTAPIAGFYQFNVLVTIAANAVTGYSIVLVQNSTTIATETTIIQGTNSAYGLALSKFVQLAANDTVNVNTTGTVFPITPGVSSSYFEGFFVSNT